MIETSILKFHEVIKEVLTEMDRETAEEYLRIFTEKLNEQTHLQENSGASR